MGCFSSPKQHIESVPTMSTGQQGIFNPMLSRFTQGLVGGEGVYGGQRVAPLSGMTQQGLEMMGQGAQSAAGLAQTGAGGCLSFSARAWAKSSTP